MAGAEAHHRLQVEAEVGALRLDVRLEFAAPWTVIFGPSGSGKSSLLKAMCGLLDAAKVEFLGYWPDSNGDGRASRAGEWYEIEGTHGRTAIHWRGLSYAPQGAAIFQHLNVVENVAFALKNGRWAGASRQASAALVEQAIKMFELDALKERRSGDLSGGEQQRVNLARAFAVPAPRLMLLDEPFAGVDRATRDALLLKMRERLAAAGVPAISVTHDVEEALLLDADVVRLEAGKVVARGPASEVLAEERARMLRVLQTHSPSDEAMR